MRSPWTSIGESVERLYGHLPPEAEQHESRQSMLVQPWGWRHDNVPSHCGERGLVLCQTSKLGFPWQFHQVNQRVQYIFTLKSQFDGALASRLSSR
jgi:hypothetical protein